MKLMIFSQYYYPERFLITEIAERLVKDGNEVTVVTGLPCYNFPDGKIPEEYTGGKRAQECLNGVTVIRCDIAPRGVGKLQRLKNYFSYMFKASARVKQLADDADAVFVYQLTPVFMLYPAIRYCRRHGKRLVCYCLDLAPESGWHLFGKLPLGRPLYAAFSKWLYSKCDTIAVTSESFIDYHKRVNGVPQEKLVYLPQHASDSMLAEDLHKPTSKRREFLFAGNMGVGASLETIVHAAKQMKADGRTDFAVRFIGSGTAKDSLVALVEKENLGDCVLFEQAVPMEQMPAVYKTADALLITLRKGQITVPGKLQTYMATGKPIFGAMDGSGKELIHAADCGRCADAEDSAQLAAYMTAYLEAPEAFDACGEKGRAFFRRTFTLDRYMEGLYQILQG